MKRSRFGDDLEACRSGQMTFDRLFATHAGIFRLIARKWVVRCPQTVTEDDLLQELRIETWRSLREYDPARGVPLASYVRLNLKNKMMVTERNLGRAKALELRYLRHQIVEEKVVEIVVRQDVSLDDGQETAPKYESVTPPWPEEQSEVIRKASRVVGRLPSAPARVIAGILTGEDSEVAARRVYGAGCKQPRKCALRALSMAAELIQSEEAS